MRVGSKKARTSSGETLSSKGTAPLKPKDGLSGPPVPSQFCSRAFDYDRPTPYTDTGITDPNDLQEVVWAFPFEAGWRPRWLRLRPSCARRITLPRSLWKPA